MAISSTSLDPLFSLHRYLLNQKVLRINEQYTVADESGRPLIFIERKAHLIRRYLALVLGFIIGVPGGILVGSLAHQYTQSPILSVSLGFIVGLVLFVGIIVLIEARRHIQFYADERREKLLLQIHQNEKLTLIRATYDVRLPDGSMLGRLIKPQWADLFRKVWKMEGPDQTLWATAHEDSLILALLRRFIGPLFGLLRTNFVIYRPGTESVLGQFNRKMTLFDRYVLDMTADPQFELDRRMALALAVMLDTGENR